MREKIWLVLAGFVVLIGAGGYLGRDSLRAQAFALTGEEDLGPQMVGMLQLGLNVVTPPRQTMPDVEIAYTDVNPYGINTFLQQEVEPEKRDESLRLISEAGFHWIRQEFPWQDIEIHGRGDFVDRRNDPDGVEAWAKYDNIVDLSKHYNIEIIARLSSPPAWSRAGTETERGSFAPPDDFEDFANYASEVASRYKGRVTFFQVWNEPNIYPEWGEQIVNPEEYTELLCMTYKAIKQANPDAVVLSGALAATNELSGRDFSDYLFLERMYRAGAGKCFDILSMQGYGLWSGPTDQRMRPLIVNYGRNEFIRDIMVRNGDEHKPIWISEMNWNAAPEDVEPRYGRVTLDQQARWAPLAYERAQKDWPWVGVISYWYFKRADDQYLRERRPEAYFQMVAPDFSLMPVYDSMKDFTHGPHAMYRGNHASDHWIVNYGPDWTQTEQGMSADAGSESVTFMFQGTDIEINFATPDSEIAYSVDGGTSISVGKNAKKATWRGWWGMHTITIEPQGSVAITAYKVKTDIPLPLQMLLVLAIVVSGTVFALTRKLGPENG